MSHDPHVIVQPGPGPMGEVTLPGAQNGFEARITGAEARSVRFLVAIAVVTACVFGLVSGLGFQLLRHVLRGEGVGMAPECVEGDDTCAEGQVCEFGFCRDRLDEAHNCQVGDPNDSMCVPGRLHRGPDGVYVVAETPTGDVCNEPRVREFLGAIARKCVSLKSCKGEEFKDFAIGRSDFLDLVTTFPGTMALHFPAGKPSIDGEAGEWPGEAARAHYVEGLQPMVGAFKEAQTILLVALASPGEVRKRSDARSYQRARLAEEFVSRAARQAGLDNAGLDAIDAKLKSVLLGDRKRLGPKKYAQDMLTRSITWDADDDRHFRTLLERTALTPQESRYRNALVNQAVFVVPIPCAVTATGGS